MEEDPIFSVKELYPRLEEINKVYVKVKGIKEPKKEGDKKSEKKSKKKADIPKGK